MILKLILGAYVVQFSLPLRAWYLSTAHFLSFYIGKHKSTASISSVHLSSNKHPVWLMLLSEIALLAVLFTLLWYPVSTWSSFGGYISSLQIRAFIQTPSSTCSFLTSFWERILSLLCMDPSPSSQASSASHNTRECGAFPSAKNNTHFFTQFQTENQVPCPSSHFTVQIVR